MPPEDRKKADELAELSMSKDVQEMLAFVMTGMILSMLEQPVLTKQAQTTIAELLVKYLFETYIAPGVLSGKYGLGDKYKEMVEKMMSNPVEVPKEEKPITKVVEKEIEEFYNIMKILVEKNKGKKVIRKTKEVDQLLNIISSYKGTDSKIMKDIQEKLKSKNKEEQVIIIKDFLKNVI